MNIRKKIFLLLFVVAIILGTTLPLLASVDGLRDINKATIEELTEVKGIGEKKAEKIIRFISERGRINSMDELLEVKGVGKVTLEELKKHFVVKEEPM
ncbi:MAG: helix-hairpin-helix domain-containing protein [Nitrospirae bacterium]|nr:MAG: helix-hairpin-helix domain-containing protein [Nitrospirota bacterium]